MEEECERVHFDPLPTVSKHVFRPMSIPGPWWFRTAWAGWYWLEFSVTQWHPEVYPRESAFDFTINLRLLGRAWTARFKKGRHAERTTTHQ